MSEQRAVATMTAPTGLSEVRAQRPALLPTAADLAHLLSLGEMLAKSGLLPQSLRTREAVATVILKGNELGLPPMAALEGIAVVQGKAVIGAHLLLGLVKRAYGPGAMWVSETTNDACTVSYRVPGVARVLAYTFTLGDAQRAGLADKATWKQYPAAMLRARAISAAAKLAFPEVVGGLYVAGELPGTQEMVTDDGDVVIDHATGEIVHDAPPDPATPERPARSAQPASPRPDVDDPDPNAITRPQQQKIKALMRALDLSGEQARDLAMGWVGVGSTTEMNRQQASTVIDRLENMEADLLAAAEEQQEPLDAEVIEVDAADADRWTR